MGVTGGMSSVTGALAATFVFATFGFGRRFRPASVLVLANSSHTPVAVRSFCTCSVGWAPCASHASAFSPSMSMNDGSWRGAYLPMISMKRPSRGERPSATTTR
jgi:hypothetical protein